jgi:polysaccharide pyruvyl transferase WcaK-like protein
VKRICISGVYSDVNKGSAALTAAAIEAAQRAFPGARISLLSLGLENSASGSAFGRTRERYPYVEILPPAVTVANGRFQGIRALLRSLLILACRRPTRFDSLATKRVRESDMVMARGGVILFDRHSWGGLASMWLGTFPLLLALRMEIRTALWGAHIGPLVECRSRLVARMILRRVDTVFVRGPESRRVAENLGVEAERIVDMPDSVFGLRPPNAEIVERILVHLRLHGCRFGVIAMSGHAPRTYDIDAFCRRLLSALRVPLDGGLVDRVVVVVHVPGSDTAVSRRIVDLAADDRYTYVDADLGYDDLIGMYSKARFVLGVRLHAAVFGVVGGTLSYPFDRARSKAHDVFDELGLGDFVIDFPAFDSAFLAQRLMDDMANEPKTRQRVHAAAVEAQGRASTALEKLGSMFA